MLNITRNGYPCLSAMRPPIMTDFGRISLLSKQLQRHLMRHPFCTFEEEAQMLSEVRNELLVDLYVGWPLDLFSLKATNCLSLQQRMTRDGTPQTDRCQRDAQLCALDGFEALGSRLG